MPGEATAGVRSGDIDIGVLTVVVVLLLAMTARRALLLVRGWNTSRRWMAWTLVFWAVVLGVAGGFEGRHQWVQARATSLVEHESGVHGAHAACQRFTPDLLDVSQYSGYVSWDSQHVAQLRRTVCNDLADWLVSDKRHPTAAQIRAVHVTVHEAMHVAGITSEATAECDAMQHDAEAATFLGASPAQGRALALAYYRGTYPFMADGYTSASCVEDGPLDLSPRDGTFP